MLLVIYLVWLVGETRIVFADAPLVTTSQGSLRGTVRTSLDRRPIFSYLGIPYAQPPVGERRFKIAEPPEPWEGVRDASQHGNVCPQLNWQTEQYSGNEDCLFLNVYTPQLPSKDFNPRLAVMVFFHGGAWMFGNGDAVLYGPDYLADHNVTLVTVNFRIGALGFLSTDDSASHGNFQLHDQIRALQWVQTTIARFGGNPSQVTIFGNSAGSRAVHFLMLSPLASGLFKRAIGQSGTALDPLATDTNSLDIARRHSAAVGCPESPNYDLVSCMRRVDAKTLTTSVKIFKLWDETSMFVYRPRIDAEAGEHAVIPLDPRVAIDKGRGADISWMIGINRDEGGSFTYEVKQAPSQYEDLISKFEEVGQHYLEFFPRRCRDPTSLSMRVKKFYEERNPKILDQFIKMKSDRLYMVGMDSSVKLHVRNGGHLYKYLFEQESRYSFINKTKDEQFLDKVVHTDELKYVFSMDKYGRFRKNSSDEKMARILSSLWANFAKTGNPTTNIIDFPEWPLYDVTGQQHMRLSLSPSLSSHLYQERAEFWYSLPINESWNPYFASDQKQEL